MPVHTTDTFWAALEKLGIKIGRSFQKGQVKLPGMTALRMKKLQGLLHQHGLIYTMDKKEIISEKIKVAIMKMLEPGHLPDQNISLYISQELGNNYTYLSAVFSQLNGLTIEQYIIKCRVAHAKKLLVETGAGIGVIAKMLHYSSMAHFSSQFKKITGFSPSRYKSMHRHQLVE